MMHSHVMLDDFGFTYEPLCVDYDGCPDYQDEDE